MKRGDLGRRLVTGGATERREIGLGELVVTGLVASEIGEERLEITRGRVLGGVTEALAAATGVVDHGREEALVSVAGGGEQVGADGGGHFGGEGVEGGDRRGHAGASVSATAFRAAPFLASVVPDG